MASLSGAGASGYDAIRDLKWSPMEKSLARKAFDLALKRELESVMIETKRRAEKMQQPSDLWELERYLTERRTEIDRQYEYKYSVLIFVFGNLIRQGRLPLVVRWMASGPARQLLWRPEFNGDVLFCLDGPSVQESRLVTPKANGSHCSRKKGDRAAHVLYIQHLAELSDGGADLYGFGRSMSISRHWITRPNERYKLTGLQASGLMDGCRSGVRRNKNRKLRGHRKRRRGGDRFLRENQPEGFGAVAWASDKDCGRR